MGASSRLRTLQYLPCLQGAGVDVTVQYLLDDNQLQNRYGQGRYGFGSLLRAYAQRVKALLDRHSFDLLWIEKEALQWWPLWAELALLKGVPYMLDYDDAVFHSYDMHRMAVVRRLYGRRLDGLMAKAALVVGGNEYLAQRARAAGARWVEVVPTVIDLDRYPVPVVYGGDNTAHQFSIVWIGSPSTARYLELLEKSLQALAKRWPLVLRVIGAEFQISGVQVQCVPWSEATEVESIAAGHVGVMPLLDSAWEQGKCGYKLIQYMACGLPVVASSVGVNTEIVQPGGNGFWANSDEDWVLALEQLLTQAQLRQRMGRASRAKVEAQYCIQKTGPKMAALLKKAAMGG